MTLDELPVSPTKRRRQLHLRSGWRRFRGNALRNLLERLRGDVRIRHVIRHSPKFMFW
jgi:hypothetical protein